MLDQQRLRFLNNIDELSDDDRDSSTILAAEDLGRSAPTPVEQRLRG